MALDQSADQLSLEYFVCLICRISFHYKQRFNEGIQRLKLKTNRKNMTLPQNDVNFNENMREFDQFSE